MTHLVRRMAPGEWRRLREIRLEALLDTPTAFSSSYAEVAARADACWQEAATVSATSPDSATFVACDENDDWLGTASVEPLLDVPDHAHIHAVYVRPALRGPTRLADRLMTAAIRFAQEHIDVARLTLGVHESNRRALAFYHRIGFQLTGKVIPYRPNPAEKCYILGYPEFKRPASGSA